eukprot:scpid16914/ scgid6854/ 
MSAMPRFISGFGISSCGVGDLYAFPNRTSPSSPMHPVQVIRGGARCILCQCHHRRLMDICRETASHECPQLHMNVPEPLTAQYAVQSLAPSLYQGSILLHCSSTTVWLFPVCPALAAVHHRH